MVCTSNPGYRDRVVSQIVKYFNENPHAKVAACSADDEPAYWCQCEMVAVNAVLVVQNFSFGLQAIAMLITSDFTEH